MYLVHVQLKPICGHLELTSYSVPARHCDQHSSSGVQKSPCSRRIVTRSSIQRDNTSKMAAVKCVCKTSYSVPAQHCDQHSGSGVQKYPCSCKHCALERLTWSQAEVNSIDKLYSMDGLHRTIATDARVSHVLTNIDLLLTDLLPLTYYTVTKLWQDFTPTSSLDGKCDWILPQFRALILLTCFGSQQMRYRPGLPLVLHGVTCDIQGQEKIGIVGRTGSGKSSLAVVLLQLVEVCEGSICIDGVDVSKLGK